MEKVYAIACAVINPQGKILLLKRSPAKSLSPDKWFVVGAYPMRENDDFEKKLHEELVEETGQDGNVLNRGEIKTEQAGKSLIIKTFLADRINSEVVLNNEHTEYKWVDVSDVPNFDSVPGTYELIRSLLNK
jgi:isopentenyldiphosphate isomerase